MIFVSFLAAILVTQQTFNTRRTYDTTSYTFTWCTFLDCSTTVNGGAVYFNGPAAVLNFSDCSFTGCKGSLSSSVGIGIYCICSSFFTQRLRFADCVGVASMSFEAYCSTASQNNCTLSVNHRGKGRDTYTVGGSCMYNEHNCTGMSAITGTILRRDNCPTVVDKYLSVSDAYTIIVLTFSEQTVSDSRFIWLNNITSSGGSTALFELNSISTLEVHEMYLINSNLARCHNGNSFTSARLYDCYLDLPSAGLLSASNCVFEYTGTIPESRYWCSIATRSFTAGRKHRAFNVGLLFAFTI